jgi:hypothetical protein
VITPVADALLGAGGPGGVAWCGLGEDPVRASGPAQEPAAGGRFRHGAVGVEAATCDDVRQPVDCRPEPDLEILTTYGLDLAAQLGQGLGLGGRRAQAEEEKSLPPGVGGVRAGRSAAELLQDTQARPRRHLASTWRQGSNLRPPGPSRELCHLSYSMQ